MKTHLASFLRPTVMLKPKHAIFLFVLLQLYFASNTLSFGFWKSSDIVFRYMLVFYGAWLGGFVLLLALLLTVGRRFSASWFALAVLVVLSIPFSWDLWIRSIEIDSSGVRDVVRFLLLPAMYLYFRIGLERVGWTACAVLVLCVLSFAGHAGLSDPTGPSHDFDTVEMDKKTNVHVIMLDALTHSPFSETFMGVENPAADHLATLNDTIYAGSLGFSEFVPTMGAWGALFNLGRRSRDHGFFSGSRPSRLTALLRENGYRISTGYSGDFFGWRKGKYVDHYHRGEYQSLKGALVCTSREGKLGFCSKLSQSIFLRLSKETTEGKHERKREWSDMVVDLIDRAEREATGPLFSAFYIYLPIGHTPKNYRSGDSEMFAEYRQFFVDGVQHARKVIENIDRLRVRYPGSIFIVAGDHGPYVSRGAPEEDRRFIVLDRHGVALALLNASNLCAWSRDWLSRQRYLTPSRMLVASFACKGESRRLTEHFTDNEEFIRFGESLAAEEASGESIESRGGFEEPAGAPDQSVVMCMCVGGSVKARMNCERRCTRTAIAGADDDSEREGVSERRSACRALIGTHFELRVARCDDLEAIRE